MVNFVDFLDQVIWVDDGLNYDVFVEYCLDLLILGVFLTIFSHEIHKGISQLERRNRIHQKLVILVLENDGLNEHGFDVQIVLEHLKDCLGEESGIHHKSRILKKLDPLV